MFISNRVHIAMATQPVITVWTILEWGSPDRDLKHLQVQKIFFHVLEVLTIWGRNKQTQTKINETPNHAACKGLF